MKDSVAVQGNFDKLPHGLVRAAAMFVGARARPCDNEILVLAGWFVIRWRVNNANSPRRSPTSAPVLWREQCSAICCRT
jgi:hypothetical protein